MRVALVAGGLVLVGLALAAVLIVRAREGTTEELREEIAAQAEQLDEERAQGAEMSAKLAADKRRAERAEETVAALRAELATIRADLDARIAAEEAQEAVPSVLGWRDVVRLYPAFRPDGLDEALAEVDWEVVADSMSHMPPLIVELANALNEGRAITDLPPETLGSIQQYNAPLVTTAMRLAQKGVAGTEVNGAFSHPGFMANAIAATLIALELPLDAEQSARLEHVAADYSARETQRVEAYGEKTFVVERLVDESRLKHDYFQEVYAILTEEQHAALRPEPTRGRTSLDLFNEGLMWAGRAGPMIFTDDADLRTSVGAWFISRARIPESAQERTREMVGAWVDDLPVSFLAWEADGLVRSGMLHVEHVTDSATRVLGLLRKLENELALDDAQRAAVRAVPGSIVIYRSAGDG